MRKTRKRERIASKGMAHAPECQSFGVLVTSAPRFAMQFRCRFIFNTRNMGTLCVEASRHNEIRMPRTKTFPYTAGMPPYRSISLSARARKNNNKQLNSVDKTASNLNDWPCISFPSTPFVCLNFISKQYFYNLFCFPHACGWARPREKCTRIEIQRAFTGNEIVRSIARSLA